MAKVFVGRAAVRVMPDTTGFRKALQTKLAAVDDPGFKVKIEADIESLKNDIIAAVERAERQAPKIHLEAEIDVDSDKLRRKLQAMGDVSDADIFGDDWDRRVERLRKLLKDIDVVGDRGDLPHDMQLHVKISDDQMRRELKRAWSWALANAGPYEVSARLEVELDEHSYKHVKHKLDELAEDRHTEFEPTWDGVNGFYVARRMDWLARDRWVQFHPVLNAAAAQSVAKALAALAGVRLADATLQNLKDLFKNLDKNIPLIGSLALALMGLSAWALAASSNLFSLARALAQMGQAALALPGIAGGFAFGLYGSIIALRKFADFLPGIKKDMEALHKTMERDFWSVAAKRIKRVWPPLFRELSNGMRVTQRELGNWYASFAEGLAKHVVPDMAPMFSKLAFSIRIASEGTKDFARAIGVLGKRGSEYLPRLAEWSNRVAKSFADWLERSDKSGRINAWIDNGIRQLGHFARLTRHFFGTLTSLARGAEKAGGSTLESLSKKMLKIREAVESFGFQDGLVRYLKSAHDAMATISSEVGKTFKRLTKDWSHSFVKVFDDAGAAIGKLFNGLFKALNRPAMHTGLRDMFRGIRDASVDLQKVLPTIGDAVGRLMTSLGNLARKFAPVLAEIFRQLSNLFVALAPTIDRLVSSLSGRFLNVLRILEPVIESLAIAFVSLIEALESVPGLLEVALVGFLGFRALQPIVPLVTSFGKAVGGLAVGGVLSKLAGGFKSLWATMTGFNVGLWGTKFAFTLGSLVPNTSWAALRRLSAFGTGLAGLFKSLSTVAVAGLGFGAVVGALDLVRRGLGRLEESAVRLNARAFWSPEKSSEIGKSLVHSFRTGSAGAKELETALGRVQKALSVNIQMDRKQTGGRGWNMGIHWGKEEEYALERLESLPSKVQGYYRVLQSSASGYQKAVAGIKASLHMAFSDDSDTRAFVEKNRGLFKSTTADLEEHVRGFGKAMADAVGEGSRGAFDTAIAMTKELEGSLSSLGIPAEKFKEVWSEVYEAMDGYVERTAPMIREQLNLSDSVNITRDNIGRYLDGLERMNGITPSYIKALSDTTRGHFQLVDASKHGGMSLNEFGASLKATKAQQVEFNTTLSELVKLGAPQELVAQFAQAGPEVLGIMKQLTADGGKSLKEFLDKFYPAGKGAGEGLSQGFNDGLDGLRRDTLAAMFPHLKSQIDTNMPMLWMAFESGGIEAVERLAASIRGGNVPGVVSEEIEKAGGVPVPTNFVELGNGMRLSMQEGLTGTPLKPPEVDTPTGWQIADEAGAFFRTGLESGWGTEPLPVPNPGEVPQTPFSDAGRTAVDYLKGGADEASAAGLLAIDAARMFGTGWMSQMPGLGAQITQGIGDAITVARGNVDSAMMQLATFAAVSFADAIGPAVAGKASGIGAAVGDAIGAAQAQAETAASNLGRTAGVAVAAALSGEAGGVRTAANTVVKAAVEGLTAGKQPMLAAGKAWGDGIVSGFTPTVAAVRKLADSLRSGVLDSLKPLPGDMKRVGQDAGSSFIDGLKPVETRGETVARSASSATASAMRYGYDSAKSAGGHLVSGFASGIRGKKWAAVDAAKSVAAAAQRAMRVRLDIRSPSRVGMEIGGFLGEGFAIGIDSEAARVEAAAEGLALAAERGIERASLLAPVSRVGDDLVTDTDAALLARGGTVVHYTSHNPVARSEDEEINDALVDVGAAGVV